MMLLIKISFLDYFYSEVDHPILDTQYKNFQHFLFRLPSQKPPYFLVLPFFLIPELAIHLRQCCFLVLTFHITFNLIALILLHFHNTVANGNT